MNQLGFSLKEANGTLVLAVIILTTIGISVFVSNLERKQASLDTSSGLEEWFLEVKNKVQLKEKKFPSLYTVDKKFNPNTITTEDWLSMGVSPIIAERIGNYLKAGGSFRKPQDLYKIYGIDSFAVTPLLPYVEIPTGLPKKEGRTANRKTTVPSIDEKKEKPRIALMNINDVDSLGLIDIYGIGGRLASRILKYRNSLGGYHHPDQLEEVYFLEDSVIDKMKSRYLFDSSALRKIHLNEIDQKSLQKHPYVNYNLAKSIVTYRKVHGPYTNIEDLKNIKLMVDSTFVKLIPYLSIKEN